MDYNMEELLPLITWLTDKYTSKESTSVPYETAQMLMEAVLYCMDQNREQYPLAAEGRKPTVRVLYERGYDIVLQKVYTAKELHEQIMVDFEDYGCINYRETVQQGMPAFFINYEPRFQPQNHLLTMDYPLIRGNPDMSGVNLILEYLRGIGHEQQFLNCFPRSAVVNLLESIVPEYEELYLDNICQAVLLRAIECFIAECPVRNLTLDRSSADEIGLFFEDDNRMAAEAKVVRLIRIIMKQFQMDAGYFEKAAPDIAFRICPKRQ